MELITTLGIDWKLLITQLINFGILIVVLSYLVYRPIIRLIDDRRERIRKSMEDAKALENQRKDLEQWKADHMRKLDAESGKYLEAARKDAEAMKKEILAGAEKEATAMLAKARQQMDEDRSRITADLQKSVASVAVKMASKIIEKSFDKSDQDRLLKDIEKDLPALLK